jgi:hypothetical protein
VKNGQVFKDGDQDGYTYDFRALSFSKLHEADPYEWFRMYVQTSARDPFSGEIRSLSGLFVHVEHEIATKARMEASERHLKTLLDKAPIGIFEITENMHCKLSYLCLIIPNETCRHVYQ